MKGDGSYKFTLSINCPGFYNSPVKSTASSFSFDIHTNAAPVASELEIIPEEGVAMKTAFQLKSGGATDNYEDFPLTYEFYIEVENMKIIFGKFMDHKEISILLPFSDNLKVFYKACDNRDSCSVLEGPPVKVLFEAFTSEEMNLIVSEITYSFQRMDFANAQNQILLMALTLKNSQQKDLLKKFREFSKDCFHREIDRLSERPTEKVYLSKEDIFNFINAAHVNLKILEIEDDDLLKKLLDLLESTANDKEKDDTNGSVDLRKKRYIRDRENQKMNADVIRHYAEIILNLLESTFNRKQSDKTEIVEKVIELTHQLCKNQQVTMEKFCECFCSLVVDSRWIITNHFVFFISRD